jgi:hypothetical protein
MPILPENKARYPHDWKLRSRFVRFYRAKNRCEWCGAENGEPHPVTGSRVVLTVAHVFDERPEAASLFNLAALCQRCHNRHDAPGRQARRSLRTATMNGQRLLFDLGAKDIQNRRPGGPSLPIRVE